MGKPLTYAVVGSGASALGVLTALIKQPSVVITIFDIGDIVPEPTNGPIANIEAARAYYATLYRQLRQIHPRKFPPPKTHLGQQITRTSVGQRLSVFRSGTFGGLTNYWGATLLPFTDREFVGWPITRQQLNPYYRSTAEILGVSGRADELNIYFSEDFATLPEIQPTPTLALLDQTINRHQQSNAFRIISGFNRCSVETRDDFSNHCIYCGECMAGCVRGAVFSSGKVIKTYLVHPRVKYVRGRVWRVDGSRGEVECVPSGSSNTETIGGFAKIFISAGCPATTEIVMRSMGICAGPTMKDNAVYTFPILYLGKKPDGVDNSKYLALSNLIVGCIPTAASEPFAQIQIYPNLDYLWRYNLPDFAWKMMGPLIEKLRHRLAWARLYLHSAYSQSYKCDIPDERGEMRLRVTSPPDCTYYVKHLMNSIRKVLNNDDFYVPPIAPIRERTNSHYAGTLPFNGQWIPVSSNGELIPRRVYVCDASTFPTSPAVSPTFSIIANACRVATEALNG